MSWSNFCIHNIALFWGKNANFFADNILKIITSVPGDCLVWNTKMFDDKHWINKFIYNHNIHVFTFSTIGKLPNYRIISH
jgi:hypothetical protein